MCLNALSLAMTVDLMTVDLMASNTRLAVTRYVPPACF